MGPVIEAEVTEEKRQMLESCYLSCLELAEAHRLKSIVFCCISTGVFRFPNRLAAETAVQAVLGYLEHSEIQKVVFNVFKDVDKHIYEDLLG